MSHLILPHHTPYWGSVVKLIRTKPVHSAQDFVRLIQVVSNPAFDIGSCLILEEVLEENPDWIESTFNGPHGIRAQVLRAPELFPDADPIPLLTTESEATHVAFTPDQAFCLVAMAFMCMTYPSGMDYNDFNFAHSLSSGPRSQYAKIKCWLEYFSMRVEAAKLGITEAESKTKSIVITRRRVSDDDVAGIKRDLRSGKVFQLHVQVVSDGGIDDAPRGSLKADFANEYIGGGVLQQGRVQEEIKFTVAPECLVSMAVCSVMKAHESILIRGCIDYTRTKGYSASLEYVGRAFEFDSSRDGGLDLDRLNAMRRSELLVGFDAVPFAYMSSGSASQFEERWMEREVVKAFAAFTATDADPELQLESSDAIATGNWGCGAFGGDVQLKLVIQVLAAAIAGRPMLYYTFGNAKLDVESVKAMVDSWVAAGVSIGDVWIGLVSLSDEERSSVIRSMTI